MKRASYWRIGDNGRVVCGLCPHNCVIPEGGWGLCRARRVESGVLLADGYGCVSSLNLDPVEKKPLYHYYPGKQIFSIGGWGCNLACQFCQNWQISQRPAQGKDRIEASSIVDAAVKSASFGIAYTYNEPVVGVEYTLDCAALAKKRGLKNVLVTNGCVCPEPAGELLKVVDAANIDIKSMNPSFYKRYCGGDLGPVLDFCAQAVAAKCHVEITNLIVPGLNDDAKELAALAGWVAGHLGRNVPLHLSAYHPDFKMGLPATTELVLREARAICLKELSYVYIGNVRTQEGQDTCCPSCGATIVKRNFYNTTIVGLERGCCAKCGRKSEIILPES